MSLHERALDLEQSLDWGDVDETDPDETPF